MALQSSIGQRGQVYYDDDDEEEKAKVERITPVLEYFAGKEGIPTRDAFLILTSLFPNSNDKLVTLLVRVLSTAVGRLLSRIGETDIVLTLLKCGITFEKERSTLRRCIQTTYTCAIALPLVNKPFPVVWYPN